MPREPEWIAPVVRVRRTGQYVFLLAWERNERGEWRGHVAWLAQKPVAWHGVDVWMRAQDLQPVEGQDYSRVRKHITGGPF